MSPATAHAPLPVVAGPRPLFPLVTRECRACARPFQATAAAVKRSPGCAFCGHQFPITKTGVR